MRTLRESYIDIRYKAIQRITRLSYTASGKLGNKESLRRTHGSSWEKEIDEISWLN